MVEQEKPNWFIEFIQIFSTNGHAFANIVLPKTNKLKTNFSLMRFPRFIAHKVLVFAVEFVVFTVAVVHSVDLTIVLVVSSSHPFVAN